MHKALRRALIRLTAVPALAMAAAMIATPAGAAASHATIGANMYSASGAGYVATGGTFRFIKAEFVLPDPTTFAPYVKRLEFAVEQWSSARDTLVGVYALTSDHGADPWHIEAKVYNNKTHKLICATNAPKHPCAGVQPGSHWSATYPAGHKIQVAAAFSPGSGIDRFNMWDEPTNTNNWVYWKAGKATFGQERIVTEFGCTLWNYCGKVAKVPFTAPPSDIQVIRADDCELSVRPHGLIGFDGPFTRHKLIWTGNGKSNGSERAYPANLSQSLQGTKSDFPDGEFLIRLKA